jgi:hypothetical protein
MDVHLLLAGPLWCCQYRLISHVREGTSSRTSNYVIFLGIEGALSPIHVIRHGDTIEALENTSRRRRKEHNEDIIQRK